MVYLRAYISTGEREQPLQPLRKDAIKTSAIVFLVHLAMQRWFLRLSHTAKTSNTFGLLRHVRSALKLM